MEEKPAGTLIGTVSASDADAVGPNSDVYYMFKKPTRDFHIDGNTGQVYSQSAVDYKMSGDRSSPENLRKLVVIASDRGEPPMTSESTVTVIVEPANKYAPVYEKSAYNLAVPENAPFGFTIVTLKAM